MNERKRNIIVCTVGHYYDADRYDVCPHCIRQKRKTTNDITRNKKDVDDITHKAVAKDNVTSKNKDVINITDDKNKNSSSAYNNTFDENKDIVPTLDEQVNSVSNKQSLLNDDMTKVHYRSTQGEPVVGWIVCVKGESVGESFTLKTGRNEIGRAQNMDVVLSFEPSVSKNKHATIIFEPRHKKYYIQPGESKKLTYLNGALVLTSIELNSYDIITLADTMFVFVPLCNDEFSWDNIEKYILENKED